MDHLETVVLHKYLSNYDCVISLLIEWIQGRVDMFSAASFDWNIKALGTRTGKYDASLCLDSSFGRAKY